ncbi:MAG: hypothetical protein IJE83_03200 [Oscillospiraceae bacterium]|nr:hypothetical protein [Oscillospiraceae bacterium]MBQ2998463.1 hypothetical protein [Oscillospiraceae bacterium]MBQ3560245.1 hypothetical protein [Oscillospiraceae bacterium]MBQ6700886.1 hypothetical protein [Oscillospiraceae bacterium]
MKKILALILTFVMLVSFCGCGPDKKEPQYTEDQAIVGKWIYYTGFTTWNFVFNADGTCSYWSGINESKNSTYTMADGNLYVEALEEWEFYYTFENNILNLYHTMEEDDDWKFSHVPIDEPRDSLMLTSEMVNDIKEKIEDDTYEIALQFTLQTIIKDYNILGVEIKSHEKIDQYTYAAYLIVDFEDNYGDKFYDKLELHYTVVEDAKEPKGYAIDIDFAE